MKKYEGEKMKKALIVIPLVVIMIIIGYFLMTYNSYTPQRAYEEHYTGPLDAKVVIVEYSDYECPACRQAYPAVEQMINTYNSSVKFVYKHFPLAQHKHAQKSAEASECAYDLGGNEVFWQYHNMLFKGTDLYDDTLKDYAAQLGLDAKKFEACLNSGAMAGPVRQNFEEGRAVGVTGTPSFIINGEKHVGLNTLDAFKQIIDAKIGG
jgi:protein-disulfide isomerase